jgi:dTDP-4-dehydrorhamnose reductase
MIDLNKVLVIGGSGMVGSHVPFGIHPSQVDLDITDRESVVRAFDSYEPTAVIHLAALVDIHECERNPDLAYRVNVGGARNVAEVAAQWQAPIVFFSSGMVFDGTKDAPYDESDIPSPINTYAETKYRGEQEVLRLCANALVVRTGWLFGGFERDVKFIRRFFEMLLKGSPIRAVNDRYGSPAYVPDLIHETVRLLQSGTRGIAHVVNAGVVSYLDVAVYMRQIMGVDSPVAGVPFKDIDGIGSVKRGRMEGLISNRGISLRSYEDALAQYVAALRVRRSGAGS